MIFSRIAPPILLLAAFLGCTPETGWVKGSGRYAQIEMSHTVPTQTEGPSELLYAPQGVRAWTDVLHYYLVMGPDSATTTTVTFEGTTPYEAGTYDVVPPDTASSHPKTLYASYVSAKDTSLADSGRVITTASGDTLLGRYRLFLGGNGLRAESDPSRVIEGEFFVIKEHQ